MNIPFYWDMVVVAVWSLIIYYTAIRLRLPVAEGQPSTPKGSTASRAERRATGAPTPAGLRCSPA